MDRVALAGASMEELLTKAGSCPASEGWPESTDVMTLPAPSAPPLAMADPTDIQVADDLALQTHARIKPLVAGESEIRKAIEWAISVRSPDRP